MQRETRANLIFVIVLLLLLIPGIAITIRKRGGTFGRMIEPPPPHDALAYIDRTAGLAKHMPRIVPPETGRFVAELADRIGRMQRGLTSLVGDGRFAPVMSDQLFLQAISRGEYDGRYRVALIAWSGSMVPLPKCYAFVGERNGVEVPGTLESYEMQNMPIELRTELQSYGDILPPDGFIWLIVTFDGVAPVDGLTMHYAADEKRIDDTIDLRDATPATRPSTAPAASR